MADRLHETAIIHKDDVNAEAIVNRFGDIVLKLEAGAERREIALDWNGFRIETSALLMHGPFGEPGDLRFQASVPVL